MPQAAPTTPLPRDEEVVQVDTAFAVLSRVNLLAESNALAVDIGGSLAKLLYLQPYGSHTTAPPLVIHQVAGATSASLSLSVHVPQLRGTLHFFAFETRNIHSLLRFIRRHWVDGARASDSHTLIRATGGGSFKYAATFEREIGVTLARLDEMACTVAGLNFLLTTVRNEVYYVFSQRERLASPPSTPDAPARTFVDTNPSPFPYLLVNIGSGVSIVKVTDHAVFERVSGSSLGGGTFWGLARMLLDCATFDDVIELTKEGDNANVDMLVGDIYGGTYSSIGLDAGIIAASFGKATMRKDYTHAQASSFSVLRERLVRAIMGSVELWLAFLLVVPLLGPLLRLLRLGDALRKPAVPTHISAQYRPQDIALSLLRMVSYNIGQIAYLNARVHNLDRIYFGGNFIRNHPYTLTDISFAVNFWSQGNTKALFLRHDGYLGAIGAFIGASSASPSKIMEDIDTHQVETPASRRVSPEAKLSADVVTDEAEVANRAIPNGSAPEPPVKPIHETTVLRANGAMKKGTATRKRKNSASKAKNVTNTQQPNGVDLSSDSGSNPRSTSPSHSSSKLERKASAGGEWTTVSRIRRKGTGNSKNS